MITVNGETIAYQKGLTIGALLRKLNYVLPHIIVRLNGKLIARTEYEAIVVAEDDVIDAIHPMVGG